MVWLISAWVALGPRIDLASVTGPSKLKSTYTMTSTPRQTSIDCNTRRMMNPIVVLTSQVACDADAAGERRTEDDAPGPLSTIVLQGASPHICGATSAHRVGCLRSRPG